LGVALAAHALRVAVGLGEDHLALAIGIGADLLAFGAAGRAQLVGDALPLRLHAPVDRFAHFLRQVDALQAHVDDADADALQVLIHLLAHARHDLLALARDDLVHAADAELVAQRAGHRLPDARLRAELVALH